jgi:hypothetical protein
MPLMELNFFSMAITSGPDILSLPLLNSTAALSVTSRLRLPRAFSTGYGLNGLVEILDRSPSTPHGVQERLD